MPSKAQVKKKTIADMEKLGTYRVEYNGLIDIYAGMCEQYDILLKRFNESNMEVEIDCGFGESKKTNPIVRVIETLRKDILQYSDRLLLNPKSMMEEKNKTIKKQSPLAKVLTELG